GRNIEQLYPPHAHVRSNEPLLQLHEISAAGIVKDISLTLHKGEVLGLFGLMGSGRTELARMLFGIDTFESGRVTIHGKELERMSTRESIRNKVAFVTENRREEGLLMNINIADNIALVSLPTFARAPIGVVD